MLKEITTFIATKASLTRDTDIFAGHRPQGVVAACDVVLEAAGGAVFFNWAKRADPVIQVLSRDETYFTARARAWAIYDAIYREHTAVDALGNVYPSAGWTLPVLYWEDDILTDGGFELWDDPTHLTHWTETIVGGSTINRESTEKHGGSYSCRFDIDALNSNAQIQEIVTLTPRKKHKIIIWYKNSAAGKTARFFLFDVGTNVYLKDDGTWEIGAASVILPNSIIWKKFELEFFAHADYSSYAFRLLKADSTSSSIYFDDASILPGIHYIAMIIEPLSPPQYIGQDEKLRHEFSTNYVFKIRKV